jgi:hypothetical protein
LALAKQTGRTTVIFDPNDQYEDIPIIENLGEWMAEATPESVGRVVATDPVPDFEEMVAELDGGVWKWSDYAFVIDECSMLMSPSHLHPGMERYARTSPKDVAVILTTHRIVDVNTLYRSLATDWFVFQQYMELDLDYLNNQFGPEFAAKCKALGQFHVMHHWLAVGGVPESEEWDDPAEWFIEIGRTT